MGASYLQLFRITNPILTSNINRLLGSNIRGRKRACGLIDCLINGTQARGSGENDNNKAHKEYVKHMFPDGQPETLLAALAAIKKDLQFARRWAIWVEGYNEKKDGLVPGLGVGVSLLVRLEIKKRMCRWI
jgi:hypothetical protein